MERRYGGRWIGAGAGVLLAVVLGACAAPGPLAYRASMGPADGRDAGREASPRMLLERLLAPAAWSPDAVVAAPGFDVAALESAVHRRVNAVRADHGLAPLAWADPLAEVARGHSRDMAGQAFFGHVNPRGEDATARAARRGITPRARYGGAIVEGVGENLFLTHRYAEYRVYPGARGDRRYEFDWKDVDDVAREAVDGWLASRTHRANLLAPVYGAHGVGVVLGDNQTVYVTQNLAGR